ncbi:hypothetical protein H5V45_06905 [Nocardioides sp. KIGAM211]|uniref:Protoporphyrinogen oxidase n=1 Tax=Nocardioides luti TaxID=2761101 RepID=A0A7X0REX6_9ACTN|nr:hypothetical protein [Nocardioides luti]MBB6627048.1 hypothetical protein [Nocardioides luti]
MSKLSLLTAAGIGYVLGARAGRERYEQIAAGARQVARNPRVQSAKQQATGVVAEQAAVAKDAAATTAKEAASAVASTVADKVRSDDSSTSSSTAGGVGGAHAAARPAGTTAPPLS